MKMEHADCGGKVVESTTRPPYVSEEYGTVPAYECKKCGDEIVGDSQISFVPENEGDKVQIESMRDVGITK